MVLLNISYIIFISFLAFTNSHVEDIEARVKQGTLKGIILKSRNGTNYRAFYGIPFAKPPIDDLRFEPPQEPNPWNGTRDATTPPPRCIQTNFLEESSRHSVFGQEDCLYLNVFTPTITSKKLPTMVFIHGGAFVVGSASSADPVYFMDYPVVVVMIQYRLSILGFLSASDKELPGNYGMKDQVAALKWVQQNIKAFGGDPSKVTIFGVSAGGASTHFHMHSPLSKGLFHQVISQSGSALANWALTTPHNARVKAFAVGALSGCNAQSTRTLVKCLKKVPAEELCKIHDKFEVWDIQPIVRFPITVEPKNVEGAFLTENPWKQDIISEVPWLTGFNSDEGGFPGMKYLIDDKALTYLDKNYKRLFPIIFNFGYWLDEMNATRVADALRKFYFGDLEISSKNARNLIDLFTDAFFAMDCLEAVQRHKGNKVFLYYYDHLNAKTLHTLFGTFHLKGLGPCHGDEMISLMPYSELSTNITDEPDLAVSHRMIKYWVNFAHTGYPSGTEGTWKPSESKDLEYLHITTEKDIMKKNLRPERYNFWVGLSYSPTYTSQDVMSRIKDEF